jgi:uncharacterized membrane protein YbaN (DUF454 family)
MKEKLEFSKLMEVYNHIGDVEKHFNSLEMEYRKLASQWLLVSLGAIGFVLTKQEIIPVDPWILVISICIAASAGIMILWLLDLKVYHELLNSAFSEALVLEQDYPECLPPIRNNMLTTQIGSDVTRRVILFYFFSVGLLGLIANISIWMYQPPNVIWSLGLNILSVVVLYIIYRQMTKKIIRNFHVPDKEAQINFLNKEALQ